MYQPFNAELAHQHRNQLLEQAEAYRISKTTRAGKAAERRAAFRRIMETAVSLLAWPVKH